VRRVSDSPREALKSLSGCAALMCGESPKRLCRSDVRRVSDSPGEALKSLSGCAALMCGESPTRREKP